MLDDDDDDDADDADDDDDDDADDDADDMSYITARSIIFVDWIGEWHVVLFLGLTIQVIHPENFPPLLSKETFGHDDSDESRCFIWSSCNFLAGDVSKHSSMS